MPQPTAEESFHDYVRSRSHLLGQAARLLTGDAHLAEDLVQHALIQVASRWEEITAAGNPDPYVRRILYHQHISWWRRRRREVVTAASELPERSAPDPAGEITTSLALEQALARLSTKQRAVLILRYYEDPDRVPDRRGAPGRDRHGQKPHP